LSGEIGKWRRGRRERGSEEDGKEGGRERGSEEEDGEEGEREAVGDFEHFD
jgi:hypothetical protein